jgi:hypothetical protein
MEQNANPEAGQRPTPDPALRELDFRPAADETVNLPYDIRGARLEPGK